jgi:uncharacterized protein (TIGR00725 family)
VRPAYVAVCGGGEPPAQDLERAEAVGRGLAQAGAIVVTGGLGGVMEAASRGAQASEGTVLAIIPGDTHEDANDFASVVVPTGMGEARNALVVRAADALIAIGGEYGTLSEIALALRTGRPVIGLDTWELRPPRRTSGARIARARTPSEAVRLAVDAAERRRAELTR